jgi:hypothetical protein
MTIEQLSKAQQKAYRVTVDIEDRIDTHRRRLHEKVKAHLDRLYGAELATAEATYRAANAAHMEAANAARLTESLATLLYPEGTVLVLWEPTMRYSPDCLWRATETKAVVEVIRENSAHAANLASYSRASIGEVVLRYVTKSGQPALRYEKRPAWHTWAPAGMDANKFWKRRKAEGRTT